LLGKIWQSRHFAHPEESAAELAQGSWEWKNSWISSCRELANSLPEMIIKNIKILTGNWINIEEVTHQ
jgi:hypothetical protein